MERSRNTTTRQRRLIEAILECKTLSEAAKISNTPPSTMALWLNDPEFKAMLREAERELWNAMIRTLSRRANKAADVLGEIAEDVNEKASSRVTAARAIVDNVLKVRDNDVEERISRLEKLAGL